MFQALCDVPAKWLPKSLLDIFQNIIDAKPAGEEEDLFYSINSELSEYSVQPSGSSSYSEEVHEATQAQ